MPFKVVHFSEIGKEQAKGVGVEGVNIRWLITEEDGAKNFVMRYFEIAPGGQTPHHSHDWEHEVFILEGRCQVTCGNRTRTVGPGFVVFVPSHKSHQFRNVGKIPVGFLCLVPHHE